MRLILILALVTICTGIVTADHLINATPEVQRITTGTSVDVQGMVTETDAVAWSTVSNGTLNHMPLLSVNGQDPDDTQYTTTYNDNTRAVSGNVVLVKSIDMTTADRTALQSNIKALTDFRFIGDENGRATRDEDILIDGASNWTETDQMLLCPFAVTDSSNFWIPEYCNIVLAGSSVDSTRTLLVTSADNRFVGTDSSFPVALNYEISAQGTLARDGTELPMSGSAVAFIKAHFQETRNLPDLEHPGYFLDADPKLEDVTYSETSSASGIIHSFSKNMGYLSGLTVT